MTCEMPPDDCESLGRLVRETWVAYVRKQIKDPKPSWTAPWSELDGFQREVDMLMASVVADVVTARVRGRFGEALREHYLAGITCDHARKEDNPVCACSRVFLGWHPNVGAAVEAWIGHVMEAAGGGEGRTDEKEPDHG